MIRVILTFIIIVMISLVMILITPWVLILFFLIGFYALISLIIDLIKYLISK